MPKIVSDLQWLLDPATARAEPERQVDIVNLWDPDTGEIPAGVNYGSDPW
jgi:CRISPR-associated protein Cas1